VTSYGAHCNGSGDDTAGIQSAERAAARAGGTVVLPAGRCMLSGPVGWDSGVSLQGKGMHASTLVALPSFGFDPAVVRSYYGLPTAGGKFVGMIWLDGPTQTAPLANVTISEVGFDPRAGTQTYKLSGKGTFHCIAGYVRPLQHVKFENLYFELGANTESYIGKSLGPKGFFGIELQTLGVDPAQPSYDLYFHNIVGHNGDGTIQLGLGGFDKDGAVSSAYDIRIDGVTDTDDLNNIDDDRIVFDANSRGKPAPAVLPTMHDISIKNVTTTVSDSVTVGGVNGVKVNVVDAIVRNVTIDGVTFRGSANGGYVSYHKQGSGSPISLLTTNDNAIFENITARNIEGTNSMGIPVTASAEPGQPVRVTLENIKLLNCFGSGALVIGAARPPGGNDSVVVDGFTIQAAPGIPSVGPATGIALLPARSGQNGLSGTVRIAHGSIHGYPLPLHVYSTMSGVSVENVQWDGRPTIHRGAGIRFVNSSPL
jgi:hypothetical protein